MSKINEIYIVFYCGIDKNFSTSQALLQKTVEELFGGDQCRCVFDSEKAREIIFVIQVPPSSSHTIDAFFGNLKTLFVGTSAYTPHFTQYANHTEQRKQL